MGEFINGLLGEGSSVNKMAEAMQAAPRSNPRDTIDRPIASSEQPQQAPAQAPQQDPAQQDAAAMAQRQQGKPQGQAPPKPEGPVLNPGTPEGEVDPRSGAALQAPSPEEEKQARTMMVNVTDYLYGVGLKDVTKVLKSGKDVTKTVGETTAMLIGTELDSAEAAGVKVKPDILISVGAEVVSQIYELAAALGVWNPDSDKTADKDMSTSLNYAANLFAGEQIKTGRKDRLQGLDKTAEAIQSGEYNSKPGQTMTNDMMPVAGGEGLL